MRVLYEYGVLNAEHRKQSYILISPALELYVVIFITDRSICFLQEEELRW
jgi:hypothetical protein